jgi:hypothetical protein
MNSVKDSYCAPVEVPGETVVKDGHIVNATYSTILDIIKVTEPIEITVGENSIVNGDRTGDTTTTTKTFDNNLVGLGITESGKTKEFSYSYSSSYGKDADGKDTDEKFLRDKQITASVVILEIDGKTDKDTKIANGSKVKLTYTLTMKLTDFSGSKKDITIGETKLGDTISVDDVLKALKTPKKEDKKEDNKKDDDGHDHSSDSSSSTNSSSSTTATDYKIEFKKENVTLEGNDKLDAFLKGKNVNITGTVHIVKEKPEFTDALVKEQSKDTYKTIKELEAAVVDSVCADLAMTKLIEKSLIKKDLPREDIEEAY